MNIKLFPIDNVEIDLLQKWQNDVNIKYPLMGFRFPIQKKSIHTIGIETNEIKYKVHELFDDLILENTPLRRAINSPNKKDSTIMYTRR